MADTYLDKLSREKDLLSSLPSSVPSGITEAAKDAWEHKGRTAFELGSAVVLGTAFTLLSRNPNNLVEQGVKWAGYAFTGLAAADLVDRFAEPMHDVWKNPENLQADKQWLGNNIGDALFNYGVAIGAGGAGAYFGERALETTKFGELLSGQTVTRFEGEAPKIFGDAVNGGAEPKFKMLRSLFQPEPSDKVSFSMRQFRDGSRLITSSDGVSLLNAKNGEDYWFQTKQDWWSPTPKIESLKSPPLKMPQMGLLDADDGLLFHQGNTWKFASRSPEPATIDVSQFTNKFLPFEKGGEAGIGALASQWAFERAGDIGSAIVQHKLLLLFPKHDKSNEADDNVHT